MKHAAAAIEELAMNAQPCAETLLMDGWIIRFNNGYTKRGNSIQPLYASYVNPEKKIQEMEIVYKKKGLPVIFKMTEYAHPQELDPLLEEKGYVLIDETSVQIVPLDNFSSSSPYVEEVEMEVEMETEYTEEWLHYYCKFNQIEKTNYSTLIHMLSTIIPDTCFCLLKAGKKVVSCGLGVRQGDYIGLFDIVTNNEERRKGYGSAIVQAILNWGKKTDAKYAYLQVVKKNKQALKLYQAFGFQESYRYWYRIKE
ncbi:GNAT family N-acetyltransferase [Niallia sp. 03133]|uniref:GNAT family N-acetyltransferase n=1 Tax=Niallia sp. 03133 TaxID=3458060 RepID=UPI0040441DF2